MELFLITIVRTEQGVTKGPKGPTRPRRKVEQKKRHRTKSLHTKLNQKKAYNNNVPQCTLSLDAGYQAWRNQLIPLNMTEKHEIIPLVTE